jgi:hypothetical protein
MTQRLRNAVGGGLVETLIAFTLLALVLTAMVGVLIQQQRFYLVTGDAAITVGTLQRFEEVVTPELLPLNPAAGDVTQADPDSVALRAFRGVYFVCDIRMVADAELTVRSLTGGRAIPIDSALVYSNGTKATVADDYWKHVAVTSVSDGTCPDGSAGWTAVVPDLNASLAEVPLGAPVRAFQMASYWLTTQDGSWYMKSDALGGSPMVVSGPLAPADSTGSSILRLKYTDRFGNTTATLSEIHKIEIDVSAVGAVPTKRGGPPMSKNRAIAVKLRNAGQ